MTDLVAFKEFELPSGDVCFKMTLQAPRANALEPHLLAALHHALDRLADSDHQKALITSGRNFSTGGDVARFHDAALKGKAAEYSDAVVPALQTLVLRMIEMPVVFATALRGAVTGGSAGLLFASDIAVAAPDVFVQPYYSVVGFAPDGGWASVLPELIGGASAQSWVLANQRHKVDSLQNLGLVQAVDADPESRAAALLDKAEGATALATKSIFWNEKRRENVAAGLDAEARAFRSAIARPEILDRMGEFIKFNE